MSGGEVIFGVSGKIWVIALVGKEWRDTSSGAWSVVVGKFGKGK